MDWTLLVELSRGLLLYGHDDNNIVFKIYTNIRYDPLVTAEVTFTNLIDNGLCR